MSASGEVRSQLAVQFGVLCPLLDERQQRLAIGAEARLQGHGGSRVARAAHSGQRDDGYARGVDESETAEEPRGLGPGQDP